MESAPCGWGWTNGLQAFLFEGACVCVLVGGAESLWSAMKYPVVSFGVPMGLAWLWAACLLMLRAVFLSCWRISVGCFALELVGSWVELGFRVGMRLLVSSCLLIFPGCKSSLMFSSSGVKPHASGSQSFSYSRLKTSLSIQHR